MSATSVLPIPETRPSRRGTVALLSLATLIALVFFAAAALPYVLSAEYNAAQYAGKRGPLLLHIFAGSVALLTGPIQLWLGLSDRRMELHRRMGTVYMIAVGIGSAAAYYLAVQPSIGWVFGAGLAALATAWLATTTLAYLAIRRSLIDQHKEWMIRSYVVTFAFVTFRIGFVVLQALKVGTVSEQGAIMAWSCWALPLVATEVVLQGRKILAVAP